MRPWFFTLAILPAFIAPAMAETSPAPHPHITWEQRFTQANTTHDGQLTLGQAKDGYPSIARHFGDIDAGHKGFVTRDDIRAWHKQMRAAHRGAQSGAPGAVQGAGPDTKLKPRHAFQHTPLPLNTATSATVSMPSGPLLFGPLPTGTPTVGPDPAAAAVDPKSPG